MEKETTNDLQRYMNVGFGQRLTAFAACWVLMLIVAGVLANLVTGPEITAPRLRIAAVIQDVLLFIVPPVVSAVIVCRLPARFMLIERGSAGVGAYLGVVLVMFASIPMMNCLVAWNESLHLPESMASVEAWMRQSEDTARAAVELMLGSSTVGSLIINLLIVAVLAGFSEEMFFRGGLQQILITRPMNAHAAIWITALVFSAMHVQFYGFIPRLLLGAWFGYLAWWSRSIWLPIAAHIINNSVVVVASWLGTDRVNEIGSAGQPVLVCTSLVLTMFMVWAVWRLLKKGA